MSSRGLKDEINCDFYAVYCILKETGLSNAADFEFRIRSRN
jgi:hypothetical protein